MKRLLLLLLINMFTVIPVYASEDQGEEAAFGQMFQQGLVETSIIATQTHLNVDDLPAFVSILRQDELVKLGIEDVYEALCLVPGVEPFMESSGARQLIFRGVKEKGKVKFLLDGIDISNTFRGSIYYYYDFPIELVERIEVIRGPDAVLFGSGAISGVINIVTKTSDRLAGSKAFGSAASYHTYKGGMFYNYNHGEFHAGIDGYYTQDNEKIKAGPDITGRYGRSNEAGNDWSVGAVIENNHLRLTTRIKRSSTGTAFGRLYFLPDSDDDSLINTTVLSELQYSAQILPDLTITMKGGYTYYRENLESLIMPEDINQGRIFYVRYSEDRLYSDVSLATSLFAHHTLEGGIRFEHNQAHDDQLHAYSPMAPRILLMPEHVIKPRVSRQIGTFYINDQYHFNERIDLSLGLRYDIYSDTDNTLNPRIGIIYRWRPWLRFKAMYSKSYRVPSWIELYLNIPYPLERKHDFSPETSNTAELGMILNTGNSRMGFNIYWTQINDLIRYYPDQIEYSQKGRDQFIGGELSWDYNLFRNTDINLVLSYVYGTDQDNNKLPDIASWLGNLVFSHTFDTGITSSTHLRFASARPRAAGDSRDDLCGYVLVDEMINYRYRQASITAGIKNIFDENVRYPAPADTYPKDFPRPGRTYTVKISYDF